MHQKHKIRRILCLILTLVLLCTAVSSVPMMQAGAATLSEARQKRDQIQKELDTLKAQKADQQAIQKKLEEQVANTEDEISLVTEELNKIKAELSTVQAELDAKNAELESNKELFKQRLRAMYMTSGSGAELQVLLGSDDMADYLAKTELTRSVSAHDSQLIEEIVAAVNEVESKAAEIRVKKDAQDAVKKELAAKQQDLNNQMNELSSVLASLEENIDDKEAAYNAAVAEVDQLASQVVASVGDSRLSYDGNFLWPVPGYYNITSGFKWRWGRQHKGIDISSSGISGKPIVAAADGVVMTATYNTGGYGNYVMINHGVNNGASYVTLYGHMTRYVVSAGQSVTQGQVIGYVGSTGFSTGPHLHFEIRVNGTAVDPAAYFN